jgi:hypothetical protein
VQQKTLAEYSIKVEINAPLEMGISLDVIGRFSLTIQHWPHELQRRDALRKAKAQFPEGHDLVSLLAARRWMTSHVMNV